MIKGIYNENEFYTNFYWDSKFLEDLRSKIGDDESVQSSITALKNLDTLFWAMKEQSADSVKQFDCLTAFYKSLFQALGYLSEVKERQTSLGQSYSIFVDAKKSTGVDLLAVLVNQAESGDFESPPIFIKSNSTTTENEAVNSDLSEVLREELQESQYPPRWILVGAPNALFIIERNKWSFGRYLRIEWQELFLQRDAKPYEILFGLAARRFLCPESGNSPHDEFDDNSHRHAFEVTTELRESVREAIELLINEMIDLKKESHQKIYSTDTADQYAKELTHDALYYVYRLLFLLYLEAQGEDSDLLPLKSEIYRTGYSLEKLLELDFIDVSPDSAESKGTFLFESLDQIFNLIFYGFEPGAKEGIFKKDNSQSGFLVKGIKSDLFDPNVIKHLKGVKLRNGILLDILKKLSLTRKKEKGGKPRARVSYANLGINQLGAVYEGLLSYTGFFAQEDLHALKPSSIKQSDIDNGKELDQVYLAPKTLVDKHRKIPEKKYKLSNENTVFDESGNPKIYKKGSFIYRLAGRDRQKLASYYTPESLTKCTVKYSLRVLFETKNTLEDLWNVKILEPAMGSGAFLNESVNQLSDRILEMEIKQGTHSLSTPRAKQRRLWDIKYQLISNNVYGVDLNPTAIELARFSLWLNCIGAGKAPPDFAGRLKVGNSLIGARFKKGADGLYHWLTLDDGMMNYGKKLKDYHAEGYEQIKKFRENFLKSRLQLNDRLLRLTQEKAEKLFDELTISSENNFNDVYSRLKFCSDIWCANFFYQPEDLAFVPKSHDEFLKIIVSVLESGANGVSETLKRIISRIAEEEKFFHWDIEFPEIIQSGGFELILGNPPWVAVEWKDSLYISDDNVIPSIAELNAADTRTFVEVLGDERVLRALSKQFIRIEGYSNLLEVDFYKLLKGVSKNTYKAFDILGLDLLTKTGSFGIIQEDGILEDKSSSAARASLYSKFRYHFQFQNERKLFSEVGNPKRYSINIFSGQSASPHFDHIGNLYVPSTIDSCYLDNSGLEPLPLIKDQNGSWESRGHSQRIIKVDKNTLQTFSTFLNDENEAAPPFLNLHSSTLFSVINKIAACENTFGSWCGESSECIGSQMLNETTDQDNGNMKKESTRPKSIDRVILSGPHINTGNPLSQETQIDFKSKFSYDTINLESISDDFIQRTIYQLKVAPDKLDAVFPMLGGKPYRSYFRLLTRNMVNPTNERCLFTCIIPPGVMHINTLNGIAVKDINKLPILAGLATSLVLDGYLRLKNKTHVFSDDLVSLPIGDNGAYFESIGRRALALNGITVFYDDLWKKCALLDERKDALISGLSLRGFGKPYSSKNALRVTVEREQALIEIDALTALSFGLTETELVQTYEILFPVLNMYDRQRSFNRQMKLIEAHRFFKNRGW